MSTLLELVNETLRKAGQREVATLAAAETPVIQAVDFLNQVYFEMLQILKVNRLERTATLDTQDGTAAYSLAADADINTLIGDSVIETDSGLRLKEVDYTYPLQKGLTATGRPDSFYRQGDSLHLHPVPDAVYTLQYAYLVKPSRLANDADITALPEEWEHVLVQGTLALLEKFLGESGFSESYLLYREGLARLKSRAPMKPAWRMKGFYRGSGN